MVVHVDSVKEYFATLQERFSHSAAKGWVATYQFELSGEEGGMYHVKVDNGTFELFEGACNNPTATIKMRADDFIQVVNGKLPISMAYMKGKLKVTGNVLSAQKVQSIFPISTSL